MEFIYDKVPDVNVITDDQLFDLKSMQYLDEQEDKVILKCAEYVEQFKRGFTCDLILSFHTLDSINEDKSKNLDSIKDLVLVHINKHWDIEERPTYEYVFFK